jgi:putative transposase
MPRPPRIQLAHGIYHVVARGVDHLAIFRDPLDRTIFLALLRKTIVRCRWIAHAHCLMTTHYHVILETPEANLAVGMQHLNGFYAQLFNERHRRTGHLFQGRYGATLMQSDDQLAATLRYVLMNPVRAGLCDRADDWPWNWPASQAVGPGRPAAVFVDMTGV